MIARYPENSVGPPATRELNGTQDVTGCALHAITHALGAAADGVGTNLGSSAAPEEGAPVEPGALLALLAFCYARQIYGSTEIEDRLSRDPGLRQLWKDPIPAAGVLRRFRAENRATLESCLKSALRSLAEEKVATGLITRVSEAHLADDAQRRIITAMFTDSMEIGRD